MPAPAASLDELYRQTVLDHSRRPRNLRHIAHADHQATGHNPLCGDRVTVYLREAEGIVTEVAFEASGCAISLASASMLTELVRGRTRREVHRLVHDVTNSFAAAAGSLPGDLAALGGVRAYPSRVRCATLPWRTLEAALGSGPATVSTE